MWIIFFLTMRLDPLLNVWRINSIAHLLLFDLDSTTIDNPWSFASKCKLIISFSKRSMSCLLGYFGYGMGAKVCWCTSFLFIEWELSFEILFEKFVALWGRILFFAFVESYFLDLLGFDVRQLNYLFNEILSLFIHEDYENRFELLHPF